MKNPSVLAFERKLDPSDAVFFSGQWSDLENDAKWPGISLNEKSVRGTISNRLKSEKDKDPAKLDAAIEKPNLQTVDIAALPDTADTLKVHFTLRILNGIGIPSACNNFEYQQHLDSIINTYKQEHSFKVLASRYAYNLANGRFLWRNRLSAETVKIRVKHLQVGEAVKEWWFEAFDFSVQNFDIPASATLAMQELIDVIEKGFNINSYTLLDITAFARMGTRQEVFPSQELILDKGKSRKSKTLYVVNDLAAMHSQKIGNALRTIDTWYEVEEVQPMPIAVEPYGSVTSQSKAYRQPKAKLDFYSLLDGWMLKDILPNVEQQHFIMAILIRGGVFGEAENKE